MENNSSEEEHFERSLHNSVNVFHKKNDLSFEEDKKSYRKRSSSMSLNAPKDFVPKLKPVKSIICPSPINLNQPINPDKKNIKDSGLSIDRHDDFNLKPIKCIFSKRRKRKSMKIIKIEEETHETEAISDCEDKSKKVTIIFTDSDTSNSNEEDNSKNNKFDFLKNINFMREKMIYIRKNSLYNDNIYDDSSIGNTLKNIYQQKFITKLRRNKNMFLKPLKSIKYRTKSFNYKQTHVSTILGFLEKNNSSNSVNSNGK